MGGEFGEEEDEQGEFGDEELENDENKEKVNRNIDPLMDRLQPSYDDLDNEILQLEKKLGINKKEKYDRIKKSYATENYDDDILDFLDNIDKIVEEKNEEKSDKEEK